MNRLAVTILALTLTACATQPVTTTVAATPPPCNPGHQLVNATLWVQSSAEYRAAALQTYAAARRALDAALADPSWAGATEENPSDPPQPPAVILDLDETAIDNTAYETRAIRAGKTYDRESWQAWVSEGAAAAVPGTAEFLAYAKSRGVTPFYITNRDYPGEEPGTRTNLQRLGYPLDPNVETLLLRGSPGFSGSDKGPRRAHVAKSYRVLLLLGDDLNDFASARDKSHAERQQILDTTKEWWGTRWFILPNPMYGSWENAAIGSGGTPCERLQRKIDVLRDR